MGQLVVGVLFLVFVVGLGLFWWLYFRRQPERTKFFIVLGGAPLFVCLVLFSPGPGHNRYVVLAVIIAVYSLWYRWREWRKDLRKSTDSSLQ